MVRRRCKLSNGTLRIHEVIGQQCKTTKSFPFFDFSLPSLCNFLFLLVSLISRSFLFWSFLFSFLFFLLFFLKLLCFYYTFFNLPLFPFRLMFFFPSLLYHSLFSFSFMFFVLLANFWTLKTGSFSTTKLPFRIATLFSKVALPLHMAAINAAQYVVWRYSLVRSGRQKALLQQVHWPEENSNQTQETCCK